MIPRELLQQVRRIEIYTNRVVNETMAGRYKSVFKGQGIDFEEVRLYQPGDDIRSIDWNVTARAGEPFIKRFNEERELSVILAVDTSHSMAFGSEKFKHRLSLSDDRVDFEELLEILYGAVNRRNGWKTILARCSSSNRRR